MEAVFPEVYNAAISLNPNCWDNIDNDLMREFQLDEIRGAEKLDALNTNPKDVSGAGDSMLATASLALISGANLWEASLLGNIAAFLQVGRLGNLPIKSQEIAEIIT
mgnify:CR=1 FL=1